jgi:hypothetical protein
LKTTIKNDNQNNNHEWGENGEFDSNKVRNWELNERQRKIKAPNKKLHSNHHFRHINMCTNMVKKFQASAHVHLDQTRLSSRWFARWS